MTVVVKNFNDTVRFESAGEFFGDIGWEHERRCLDSFELIHVDQNTIPLRIGPQDVVLSEGDVALIRPKTMHEGTAPLLRPARFHWMHFRMDQWETMPWEAVASPRRDERAILPLGAHLPNPDQLHIMFDQLLDISTRESASRAYLDHFATCLLLEISSQIVDSLDNDSGAESNMNLRKVREWIRINACEKIRLPQVADMFGYSPNYLSSLFRREFGQSMGQYITGLRMDKARYLLSSTSLSIRDISESVGYSDPKHFAHVFSDTAGMSPTRYRQAFPNRHYNSH